MPDEEAFGPTFVGLMVLEPLKEMIWLLLDDGVLGHTCHGVGIL